MKKNIARATVATGLTAGLLLTGVSGAFAAVDGRDLLSVESDANKIRVWGPTRAETSVQAAEHLIKDGRAQTTTEVFIVGGGAYADTLALTPLADKLNAPVLMTKNAGQLTTSVRDELKKLKPGHVTIIGGYGAVSDEVKAEIQKTLPNAIVSRIEGADRYATAYDVAAYTVAAQAGKYADVQAKRDRIYKLEKAEADYQKAVEAFEEARNKYAAEDAAYQALADRVVDLNKQIADLSAQLKTTGDADELKAAQEAAAQALYAAKAKVDAAKEANDFVTTVVSNDSVASSTLNIKSKVSDYKAFLTGDQLAEFNKAIATIGAADSDTIENVISKSNAQVKSTQAAMETAAAKHGTAVSALIRNARNVAANEAVIEQIADVQDELDAATDEAFKQYAKVKKALADLNAAKAKLAAAVAARPNPADLEKAQRDLRNTLETWVGKGGEHTVFLADGLNFPDALAGGAGAAQTNGVILLTKGANLPAQTEKYLASAKAQVVTVGGPAAQAVKGDTAITIQKEFVGRDRYETAAAVTKYYFAMDADANHNGPLNARPMAIASGEDFADAVLASSFISQYDGGILLTRKDSVPTATLNYLDNFSNVALPIRVVGGQGVVSDGVMKTLVDYTK